MLQISKQRFSFFFNYLFFTIFYSKLYSQKLKMPSCFALFCSHDSRRETCRMFQFPSSPELRKQWLNNTRRKDLQLKPSSRICSCHFAKGKKHNGPTLFAWTNYITKIRRDLDNSTNSTESNKNSKTVATVPLTEKDALPEVAVKTEKIADDDITSQLCTFSTLSNEEKHYEIASEQIRDDNAEIIPFHTNTKDIQARVNNNPKLVNLRVENLIMAHEIEELERKLNNSSDLEAYQYERLTVEKLMDNEVLLHCYTGLNSFSIFKFLIYAISESECDLKYTKWSVVNLQLQEQMLITLMKLRCNFGFSDIAYRFRISSSTVKNIIWTFVDGLHSIFYEEAIAKKPFPYHIGSTIAFPEEFKNFSNCRIVLGSVEVETEGSRVSSTNSFKQKVLRGIVGISPTGDFIFASELYPENISFKEIIQRSGLLEKLSPGDLILTMENLAIDNMLPSNVDINVPLLTHNDVTMDGRKIIQDVNAATQYLYRAIDRLRRYSILDRILLAYRSHASKIFQLCCALTNLENSIVEEI